MALLAWRYIRNDDAIVVVTATGSLVVTVEHDEGRIQLGDNIDADLADELIADIGRHDANIHGMPITSKYSASIKVPPCDECNDEGFVWDLEGGSERRFVCSSCDPDGSAFSDLRERCEPDYDRMADEQSERLEQDVRF